jgi:nucleotide-binding universal stress UspA family protein/predicted transcriptional regulator
MRQTILVPLDGSELGEAALPWATLIAQAQGYSLTLVRIVPPPYFPTGEAGGYLPPDVYDELVEVDHQAAQDYLDGIRSRVESNGVSAVTVVRDGSPFEAIHDIADEVGAYAVAMASHGRGGFKRFLLGSVAERVLQQATIPVLLVRATGAGQTPSLTRLLIPLDGSVLASQGLDEARQLAAAGATFILVRIVEPVYKVVDRNTAVMVPDGPATDQAEETARNDISVVARSLREEGLRVETIVRRGRPAAEILDVLSTAKIDLVVMTTHGRTGASRWLAGSVADEVFRHAERPIFLVSARTVTARATGPFAVRDLMTRDVDFVREDDTVGVALRKLLRRGVSGAPVVNEKGELVGVVSELDLLAWHARAVDQLSNSDVETGADLDPSDYARRLETETIRPFVSRPALSVDESEELSVAVRLLLDRGIRRLAVTRDGRFVGILSRPDVLRAIVGQQSAAKEKETVPVS